MLEFPEWLTIPLADWVDTIMDLVLHNEFCKHFFKAIGDNSTLQILNGIEDFLVFDIEHFTPDFPWPLLIATVLVGFVTWFFTRKWWAGIFSALTVALIGSFFMPFSLPWFVVVLLVFVVAWRVMRRWWAGLIMAAFLVIIGSFGYWELAMMTLAIIITAVIISLAIGIPTGILMARSNLVESMLRPILDAMQTLPSFVYLVPVMMLFGLGKVPAVFATILYSAPPVIRLTNAGVRQVSTSVIEAARAFGSNSRQILFEVQIPLAIPSIMVGINQTTMMALAMVVIAATVGASGLGEEVWRALQNVEVGPGFQAGLSIVLLAIIIDRITHAMAAQQQRELRL